MTNHKLIAGNSANLSSVNDESVNLIVTSPPYPMIEMWDDLFVSQDQSIKDALSNGNGLEAFYKMHAILDSVWIECDRVLSKNGFICINIGDATRTIDDCFQLYSNHSRIIQFFSERGYSILPDIHWRKQSNAPNKFMGSGMYPAGAYVTYEHEYILIFRKGNKREFKGEEKERRQKSAYFWEERNLWFSDLWEIKGTSQNVLDSKSRKRSAAYPLEIPYRLINMYSVEGDTVLDPFSGLGTTMFAAMIANRNSINVDIDPCMIKLSANTSQLSIESLNAIITDRIDKHILFIESLSQEKKEKCYINQLHSFKVKTKQETSIQFDIISEIKKTSNGFSCSYTQLHHIPIQLQLSFDLKNAKAIS